MASSAEMAKPGKLTPASNRVFGRMNPTCAEKGLRVQVLGQYSTEASKIMLHTKGNKVEAQKRLEQRRRRVAKMVNTTEWPACITAP